ncbi:hypothetical protein [Streptomyces sp. NPDC004528]|uniref:hypothetical protein n=1 Tax=Streptomyces sp. NPDC004528 TaxID=3154550 RepID=UPI0033A2F59E
MSDTSEHLLGREHTKGQPHTGYVGKTNRGWAALPDGTGNGDDRVFYGFRTQQAAWDGLRKIRARDERLSDLPVGQIFRNRPLYRTNSHLGDERDFTVTIAGGIRHDGERPYTYVVSARSQTGAWAHALSHYMQEQDDIDCYVVESESFEGLPDEDCGYFWNDLRSKSS